MIHYKLFLEGKYNNMSNIIMFESAQNFFNGVGNFFNGVYNKVKQTVSDVVGGGQAVIGTVYRDVKSVVSESGNIVRETLGGGRAVIKDVITGTKDVIVSGQKEIGGAIGAVSSNLSMPLMVGLGLFGYLMINKR
jgi:phage-related protein